MDEAIHRLQQAPAPDQAQRLAQRQAQAVATLVRRAAVKHKLRGLGLKPQHYSPAQIGVMAKARLLADTQHRAELIAAARKVVEDGGRVVQAEAGCAARATLTRFAQPAER